jgi:antitoxin ParD1/3/4
MTTLNISLPETLQSFVEQQVAKGGYSNADEYILHLILQEQAKAERVEALLLEGLDSGEPVEVTDDWWEQKRTQLMQGLQQCHHAKGKPRYRRTLCLHCSEQLGCSLAIF